MHFRLAVIWNGNCENLPRIRLLAVSGMHWIIFGSGLFFFVLLHFWFLLNGVDRNGTLPLENLKMIRFGAVMFGIMYFIVVMPILFLAVAAETEDSNPGIIFIAAFVGTFPIGVAAIASILERITGRGN